MNTKGVTIPSAVVNSVGRKARVKRLVGVQFSLCFWRKGMGRFTAGEGGTEVIEEDSQIAFAGVAR